MEPAKGKITKEELKRNRRIALILGATSSIALIMTVYAFVQKEIAEEKIIISSRAVKLADSLRVELRHCKEGRELAQKISEFETKRADSMVEQVRKKK
ncbi:MAG TPA: hypothetical protein VL728_14870 [Cyclobacteriaceae bacterium]|jgi:hypothetical protein|nr:hypothetical protein [Cyclobacteriaceae bacterium]